jgi:23S rRNA pseudouridine1911/1915/1917 synthase
MVRRRSTPGPLRNSGAILFEDRDVLVVDKPAGLLTMGTDTERANTLYAALRAYLNGKRPSEKIFIVHRLDREASGLLVFAKTPEAKEHLQDQFKDHSAGREYVALVEGQAAPQSFTIRSHLAENAAHRVYSTPTSSRGKLAVTHIRVVRIARGMSRLAVRLETGRKHQIRVHLADRGHPILGDKIYGGRSNPIGRLALHGAALEFRHPRTGERLRFDAPPPQSFDL